MNELAVGCGPSLDLAAPATPAAQWRAASARRRERTAIARQLLAMPLSWAQLHACPLWCGWAPADRDLLSGVAGVCWLSEALRACIDGKRLAPIAQWVGEPRMSAALRGVQAGSALLPVEPPKPLLPPAASMVPYVTAWGQALLLWDCSSALQEPLARQLGWAQVLSLLPEFDALPGWASVALQRTRAIVPGASEAAMVSAVSTEPGATNTVSSPELKS